MKLRRIFATTLAALLILGSIGLTAAAADKVKPARQIERVDFLSELVKDGVISQSTVDAIKAYFEGIKPEGRPQNAESAQRVDMYDRLLEAKVITQTEYDALKAATAAMKQKVLDRTKGAEKPERVNVFDQFAADGVISKETATAIQEYLKSNTPTRDAIKERSDAKTDIFSKLVEEKIITQAECDAIKAALSEKAAAFKERKGFTDRLKASRA